MQLLFKSLLIFAFLTGAIGQVEALPSSKYYKVIVHFSPPCEVILFCTNIPTRNRFSGCTDPGSYAILNICDLR